MDYPEKIYADEKIGSNGIHCLDYRNFPEDVEYIRADLVSSQPEPLVSKKITEGSLKIIYENNKPYGIRDTTGFLFFFTNISKYTGQEEGYREEIEQQYRLADFLLSKLEENESNFSC